MPVEDGAVDEGLVRGDSARVLRMRVLSRRDGGSIRRLCVGRSRKACEGTMMAAAVRQAVGQSARPNDDCPRRVAVQLIARSRDGPSGGRQHEARSDQEK